MYSFIVVLPSRLNKAIYPILLFLGFILEQELLLLQAFIMLYAYALELIAESRMMNDKHCQLLNIYKLSTCCPSSGEQKIFLRYLLITLQGLFDPVTAG
jgi:hypothetical protein